MKKFLQRSAGAVPGVSRDRAWLSSWAIALMAFIAPAALATPTITINSPPSGSTIGTTTSPGGITITTTTTPTTNANIVSTQFFDNGVSLGTRGGTNPSITWVPTSAGQHTITATVTDNSVPTTGTTPSVNTATATSIVTLTTVRTATVLAPAEGTTLAQDSQIVFRATAVLSDVIIRDVEFLVDGVSIPSAQTNPAKTIATQTPYSATIALTAANGFTVGAHTLTALATATDGTTTATSVGIAINIATKVGSAPTVSVTAPTAGANVAVGAATTITATASDTDGFIPSSTGGGVIFFVDGEPVGTDLTAPYSVSWTPATAKTYSIVAQTVDDKANYVLSSPVSVTAVAASAASVSLTAPTVGRITSIGSSVSLAASASAATGGSVVAVEFLVGTTVVASDTTAPYEGTWTPTTTGAQSVTARVTDSLGNVVTSSAVSVTVSAAPTVSISSPAASSSLPAGTPVTVTANATAGVGLSVASVQFFENNTSIGTVTSAPYSISWTPSTSGTRSLTARVTDSAGAVVTSSAVSVTVTGSAASVSLTAPTAGRIASIGSTVSLAATPTASPGATVVAVEFLVGTSVVASANSSPYTGTWVPTTAGSQSVTARVTDSLNSVVTSPAVTVTVVAAPTVSISSPSASASLPVNTATTVTATATAGTGLSITSVQFLENGSSIGTATTSPYSVSWTPATTGARSLTARVTDSAGAVVISSAVSVTVTAATSAPSIALTAPVNGASVAVGAPITLTAAPVAGSGASVNRVDFLAGSTVVGTVLAAPYSFVWTPTTTGVVALTARVTDSAAATATSPIVNITVTGSSTPTVALTSPTNGSAFTVGSPVTLAATATGGGVATVNRVDFLVGNTTVGTSLAAPYTMTWTPTTAGVFALTARVTDSASATATSTAVNVSVASTAPSIAFNNPTQGAIVFAGTPVTVAATASAGTSGTITQVQFSVGSTILATLSAAPFSTTWTPSTTGNATLTARLTTSTGDTATATTSVTVNAATSSGVSLAMSPSATTLALGSRRYLTVTVPATMNVDEVRFYYDGAIIGTDRLAPFTLPFNPPADQGTGPHQLTATVIDNTGATFDTNILSLTVNAQVGAAPTAAIITPAAGAFVASGVATTISGTASDQDGSISSVTVYANNAAIGTATVNGTAWSLAWTPTTTGTVSLSAIAIDNQFNAVLAPAVDVTVTDNTSPAVALALTPGSGASATTMPTGATRNVVVTATPSAGRAIVRVEFYVDGTKVGERTTPASTTTNNGVLSFNYAFRYQAPATAGTHVLLARAYDNADTARDVSQAISVLTAVGAPPTASLVTPVNNSSIIPNNAVAIAALATAPGGSIAQVQFYQNGILISSMTAPPFNSTFTPTLPGTYVFDVIAVDDRGNTAVSNAVTVTAAFASPTIVFTAPNPNATARATPNVPLGLAATATAGSGATIQLVEFLLDGVQIGVDTTAPYTFAWTPASTQLGAHVLTARVTDSFSQTATTPALNVNVATVVGAPPTVTIATITVPAAGLQTASQVNFVATANATAAGASIANVEFFLNETSIGTAARQQSTNTYRLVYDFSRFDFSALTPNIDANTGAVSYTLPLYAIARDTNTNQTVSATSNLRINAATSLPPSVTITPLIIGIPGGGNAQSVTAGTIYALGATLNDPDGTLTNLQVFANGSATPLFTQANPSQNQLVTFTPNTAGTFNLYAIATDDTGNTAVSPNTVLTVTGNTAPSAVLVRPTDDSTTTTVNTPVFLEATASDPDTGQTVSVQFINTNGTVLATGTRVGTTDTYRAIWTPSTANTYNVAARATDSAGGQTISSVTRRVVVSNVVGIAPTISISVPTSTTTASTVNFTATASDSDGSVVSVEFFLNRNSIGQAVRDQLANTWRMTVPFAGVPVGSAEVVALARDSSGNVAASSTTTITVNAAQSIAPSITIAASSTNVAFSRQVQLTANARDTDGNVNSVQYFANGSSIGTSTNSGTNYQINWTPTQSGTFNVYAIATDSAVSGVQNTVVSAPIQVTVRRNNPVLDDSAFILQSYSDIANTTTINTQLFAQLDDQLASGALTRAQLVVNLTAENGFAAPANLLAAYYAIMGEWPTPANYTTLLATARTSLPNAIGNILSSTRYSFKFNNGATTSAATLTTSFNTSFATFTAFANRLWQNAGLGTPAQDVVFRFQNNTAAIPAGSPLGPMGRGYVPAGLTTAIAEFITVTNVTNAAFLKKAQAAALYYQLDRPVAATSAISDEQIIAPIAARIDELVKLPDLNAIADAVLKDVLYSYRYVTILKHPESLTVNARSGAIFRVEALGAPPLAYQWLLNGAPIPNATSSTLSLTNVDATRVGTYTVVVTSPQSSATSDPATLTLSSTVTRLANISTRGVTSGGADVLIGGFVVQGTNPNQTRQMLIRVVGPTLGQPPFNLGGVIANPRLDLFNSTSATPIQSNDDWGTQAGGAAAVQALQQATNRAGAFALPNNSADAAILATLQPGNYTVQARGANAAASGVVLVEVYDVTAGGAAGPKAANVSTRGMVGTGNNVLIAGFVVNGAASRRVLIRGAGPTLRNFGLPANAVLADPQISLAELGTGKVLRTNDDWATSEDAAVIAQAASAAGAFALQNGSKDAAMIVMLAPGAYTVTLSGVGNTTGIGIVEVYDVDP